MVQTPAETLTLEEFLKLPATKPASEYLGGQIIQKPMPQGKHSKLQGHLVTAINEVVESRQIALASTMQTNPSPLAAVVLPSLERVARPPVSVTVPVAALVGRPAQSVHPDQSATLNGYRV